MKNYIIIAIFVALSIASCNSNQKENRYEVSNKNSNQSEYPAIVDSLDLQKLYDDTKWRMYLLVCDDTPTLRNGKYLFYPPKTFGALDLKFDSLWQRNDTVALYFDFYVNDTLSLFKIRKSLYPRYLKVDYYNGMMFSKKTDSLNICYVSNHGDYSWWCIGSLNPKYYDTTSVRNIKPLQPYVIKYIQENRNQLNPWFRKEVEKRGIIK